MYVRKRKLGNRGLLLEENDKEGVSWLEKILLLRWGTRVSQRRESMGKSLVME